MAVDAPCTACSWTSKRQESCRYDSHVKLFYGTSDRGVWSIGSNLIVKERNDNLPNYEAENIRFLKENTTIPVPAIVEEWREPNGQYFIITKRIAGEPLSSAWGAMSGVERDRVAKQTADFLGQLRHLRSPQIQSLDGQPIFSAFLFPNSYGLPHGPFSSDDEIWDEMAKALEGISEKARQQLRQRMPPAEPYTFTHGDLTNANIIVEDGNLAGIIDWEAGGYFPVWWEFVSAGIGLGQEDGDWKALLRKHMPDYTEARQFWRDFYTLSKYPNLDENGVKLLRELEQ
ncbi:kinase-like domain-containing protein [Coniochaeta sp. 2T2.1]|nr:kinase-like domain-containing protein [Coniochaeta sp. 2T2.1]KAB5572215.1 kinase-like domain-containing protein [Coniochaeta sp. 2T2.1]